MLTFYIEHPRYTLTTLVFPLCTFPTVPPASNAPPRSTWTIPRPSKHRQTKCKFPLDSDGWRNEVKNRDCGWNYVVELQSSPLGESGPGPDELIRTASKTISWQIQHLTEYPGALFNPEYMLPTQKACSTFKLTRTTAGTNTRTPSAHFICHRENVLGL